MTPTTSDQAYTNIRSMLTGGQLLPGHRVSQSKLARQLGCSTLPILEAMRRLESEGLLVKQPRKMARVRELSADDLEGLYLLREGLEAVTARLCAQRISDVKSRQLEELAEHHEKQARLLEEMAQQKEIDPKELEEGLERERHGDMAIHQHIAQCARSPLLSGEFDRLMLLEQTVGRLSLPIVQEIIHHHQLQQQFVHRALVQAITDHDADSAEYLMRKHIQQGYQEMLNSMKKE